MFCWHDWEIFNAPSKNLLIRKIGKKYLYAFFQIAKGEPDIPLGKAYDAKDVSDLVCYKCGSKKLNLTNILNKRKTKAENAKNKRYKQREKADDKAEKAAAVKKKKAEKVKAKSDAKAEKAAAVKKKKKEAIIAARKEMDRGDPLGG